MAMAGLSLAVARGVDVPGELSMTGFDDMEISAHLQPSLTTVSTDVVAWGRAAADRLLQLIDREPQTPADLPSARLVVRASTGPAPEAPPSPCTLPHAPERRRSTSRMRTKLLSVSAAVLALGLTAACGGGSDSGEAQSSTGPIKVWLSNNPDEIAWGKAMVKEWNAAPPEEKVTAQEIPAGKTSEAVIGAAITAGNAPCLVFNTSPAAVPQFQKQGGLVPLDDFSGAKSYIEARSGASADQYKSPDGKFYQIPWKQNPVMIFYNKDLFKKAGLDPNNPKLSTYDDFLATSKKIVDSKAAPSAIAPAPSSEFFQSWFDFYPLYAAQSGGKQTIEDGKATFNDQAGKDVWNFWAQMYKDGLRPQGGRTPVTPSPTRRPRWPSSVPWAIAVYKGKVNWGVAPVPTKDGMDAEPDPHLHGREEHLGLLRLQEPEDRVGRHEVRHQQGPGRQAARHHRPDADPR